MKKFYSLVLLVVLGSAVAFGQVPYSQKAHMGALSTKSQFVSKQVASHNHNLTHNLSSAKIIQPDNRVQYIFSDNFDQPSDTDALAARGYHTYYRGGGAQAAATWFTGNATVFTAHSGATDSYVAANYQVVSGTNDIDSWLVLPALNVTTADMLSFWCKSPDGSTFPDSVRVMYSAAGDSVPEAASWVQVDNFQASVTGWEQKSYNVPTASATGRWAIRYAVVNGGPNGANSNYIGIDDLNVGQVPVDDAAMVTPHYPGPYTFIPLTQAQPIDLSAMVQNTGASAETNVGFNANVYLFQNGAFVGNVFNSPSGVAASLNPGDISSLLSAGSWTPTDTGVYLLEYTSFMTNADGDGSNDTLDMFLVVDDSTYARDYANIDGFINQQPGFNGVDGSIAQEYDVYSDAIVTSVTFWYHSANVGDQVSASVYSMSGGLPDALLGASQLYTTAASDTGGFFLTLAIDPPVSVGVGQFAVSFDQVSTTFVGLGFTNNVYTPSSAFFMAGGSAWGMTDTIGIGATGTAAFPGEFMVRPNIQLANGIASNSDLNTSISLFPNPTTGKLYILNNGQKENMTVTVFNNVGQVVYTGNFSQMSTAVIDLTKQSAGVYSVQVKSDKEITTKSVVISNK